MDLAEIKRTGLSSLSEEEFREKFAQVVRAAQQDRQDNAIRYYKPASQKAGATFESNARVLAIGGGNGSSKTESMLALITSCATGIFPDVYQHLAQKHFRGPIRARVVCQSLTTVLFPTILPKLQWWQWTGVDKPGGDRGHWGWIPPYCLRDRLWERSWSEKLRTLTLLCRNPANQDEVVGESIIQFMSVDQDPADFASGDYHMILHDEPPSLAIWTEDEARTMRVAGRMLLSMTWPDDPSIPVDWIHDKVYEPSMIEPVSGQPREFEWVNLYTTDNVHLDQVAVAKQMGSWSEEMRSVRVFGQSMRFSNRVHPLFTTETQHWCFSCQKTTNAQSNPNPIAPGDQWVCGSCHGSRVIDFNHVTEFGSATWPTVFMLDPHPRKAHCGMWVMVDPSDDLWQIDEIECAGDPTDMKKDCDRIESQHGLNIALRLMDPNMGASPSSSKRNVTWQSDFEEAGLTCDLADDSEVGRAHVNHFLKPDERRLAPRIHIHPRCRRSAFQMKRHVWDEYKRASEKDLKQVPKGKNDDWPALWKYLLNYQPTFRGLKAMNQVLRRPGTRRGAY
jgi:hypothetical protein